MHLDTPAQVVVHVLTEQRGELALRLVTNAAIGQPRRRVLGADDGPAGGVDLQAQLEAVHVVVHGVEQQHPSVATLEPRDLAALEHPALTRSRAIELGVDRRADRSRAEEPCPRLAVRETRVRQIDPARAVQLPALPRIP